MRHIVQVKEVGVVNICRPYHITIAELFNSGAFPVPKSIEFTIAMLQFNPESIFKILVWFGWTLEDSMVSCDFFRCEWKFQANFSYIWLSYS